MVFKGNLSMLKLCNIFTSVKIKSCSHGEIAATIFLSQQMVCLGFNVSVSTVRLQR